MLSKGVGDTPDSFGYNGVERLKCNDNKNPYGEIWTIGDVIGCYIDFNKREISFSRNGKDLGVAFKEIPIGEVRIL